MEPAPSFCEASATLATEDHASAMAETQLRSGKLKLAKPSRSKESKPLDTKEETREDVIPDEDAVSPTANLVTVEDHAEEPSLVPKDHVSAVAETQLRSRKPKPVKRSKKETREDVIPDEDAVSPTADLVTLEDHTEERLTNKSTQGGSTSQRQLQLDLTKSKGSENYWEEVLVVGRGMAGYTLELAKKAFRMAQSSLAVLLALWLLIAAVQHFVFPSIEKSSAFGCQLAFMSRLHLCQNLQVFEIPRIDETMKAQSDYGEVLQFVGERRQLTLDLLFLASKAADLQILIAQSNLSSREALSHEFGLFDRDINAATETFREFRAQVQSGGRALVGANMIMISRLKSLSQAPPARTENVKFLNIFSGYNPPTVSRLPAIMDGYLVLLDSYIETIDGVYIITQKTLARSEVMRQDTLRIYDFIEADEKRIKSSKREEESKWWNKWRVLKELQHQLQLLKDVNDHCDKATAFVTEVSDKVNNIKVALDKVKRQAMKPNAQYKWGELTEETVKQHLIAWYTALADQIVSLEQALEAIAWR